MSLQINVDVPDLEAGIAFYGNAFGFALARRLFGGTVAELSGAPCPFFLIEKEVGTVATPRTTAASRRDYARHWTPVHLDVVVPDVEQAVARAVAAGATVEADVATDVWGKIAVLADPFGHGFCLIELLGRGYGEVEDAS
jgi:uncharacterized glyoxalase superfamily protein PhnB